MNKTIFNVPKMDCPSEERLIKMALEKIGGIKSLTFDLGKRRLTVIHSFEPNLLESALTPLNLGARILVTTEIGDVEDTLEINADNQSKAETKVLQQLLAINGLMFVLEASVGWFAQSAGLIADSLDMFADAAVYGFSLYAVSRTTILKHRAAKFSGFIQLALVVGAFVEVVRRFVMGSEPEAPLMMGMAFIALLANMGCMALLAKHRNGEVHMKASWIFSTNDVIANLGVIFAGVLVHVTSSAIPDLLIGVLIASVVFTGAIRILKIAQ